MNDDVLDKAHGAEVCAGIGCQDNALVGIADERLLAPDHVESQHGRAYLCARHFWEQTDPEAHRAAS